MKGLNLMVGAAVVVVATQLAAPTTTAVGIIIERVSVDSAGDQGNGVSYLAATGDDGNVIAWNSTASDLVANDTNGTWDIFVRSRQPGVTQRVSVGSGGTQANGASYNPSISGDGRYVAFHSFANNLVAGDTNGENDVFVHDRQTGFTERVSVRSDGTQANAASLAGFISPGGQFVAFESLATNLVSGDTNGVIDVFVRNRETSTTTRVSVDNLGNQGDDHSSDGDNFIGPHVTRDGRFVAFESSASNLVSGDTNGQLDVFVRDVQAETTSRVSMDGGGSEGNGPSTSPFISDDARYVSFVSLSNNLVLGDSNFLADVFIHDRFTGLTERGNVNSSGTEANGPTSDGVDFSRAPMSSDGRFVAFNSAATNLVQGDTNSYADIFVRDRTAGVTLRISLNAGEGQANGSSHRPSITADGRYVTIDSNARNLVLADTNDQTDVFVRDLGPLVVASVGGIAEQPALTSLPSVAALGRDYTGYIAGVAIALTLAAAGAAGWRKKRGRDRVRGSRDADASPPRSTHFPAITT